LTDGPDEYSLANEFSTSWFIRAGSLPQVPQDAAVSPSIRT
jgi:hypothetical protein